MKRREVFFSTYKPAAFLQVQTGLRSCQRNSAGTQQKICHLSRYGYQVQISISRVPAVVSAFRFFPGQSGEITNFQPYEKTCGLLFVAFTHRVRFVTSFLWSSKSAWRRSSLNDAPDRREGMTIYTKKLCAAWFVSAVCRKFLAAYTEYNTEFSILNIFHIRTVLFCLPLDHNAPNISVSLSHFYAFMEEKGLYQNVTFKTY